ncbi:CD40 ligand isoform X5 [Motacilla alba alba]|nr:CD40 ligand isoform X5 [Motacilla alba alba]XP_037979066.1 CD40 ligand isoform X5 [Motacilla alba alba]
MEEVLSLNEDYIFLKKVQKCQRAEGQKSTLLDCEKIIKGFQNIQRKVHAVGWIKIPLKKERGSQSNTELHPKDRPPKEQAKFEMQRGPEHHEHPHLTHRNETSVAADKREPIAVHLAGQQSNKAGSVLEWRETMYGPTNSLISNKEGKLKVKEAGLYYIYSQVSFCTTEVSLAPFTLYIYLHIPKEEDRLLLKGQKTQTSLKTYEEEHLKTLCGLQSIRVGGVFNLREDDMVFVNVTDSTKVRYSHGNTYFGIFKL